MIRIAALIAAMMATPAIADFQVAQMPVICTTSYDDFEDKFGKFDDVEFSDPTPQGVAQFNMENDRYKLSGLVHVNGTMCVTWAHDLGVSG